MKQSPYPSNGQNGNTTGSITSSVLSLGRRGMSLGANALVSVVSIPVQGLPTGSSSSVHGSHHGGTSSGSLHGSNHRISVASPPATPNRPSNNSSLPSMSTTLSTSGFDILGSRYYILCSV